MFCLSGHKECFSTAIMHNGSPKKITSCCLICIVVRERTVELLPELFIAAFVLHQAGINLPFPLSLLSSKILVI